MKVQCKVSKSFIVEAEGTTAAELFENLAKMVETYSIEACGLCGGEEIVPVSRTVAGDIHYEMRCRKCNARLTISKKKTGELYPRRKYHEKQGIVKAGKAKAGDYIKNNGWELFKKEVDDNEE